METSSQSFLITSFYSLFRLCSITTNYDSQRRTSGSTYKEGGLDRKFECGFKWFCKSCYLRQKSTEQSILRNYEELVERFSHFCTTCDGELAALCNKILQIV